MSEGSTDRVPAARRPVVSVALTIATVAVLLAVGSRFGDDLPVPVGHALSHLVLAGPLAVLVVVAVRSWPPARRTPPGPLGRRVAVGGLTGVALGQLLEVAGARVDEPEATALEELAHTAGQIVTMLSLPVVIVGAVLALVAGARDGAVPWWAAALVVLALVGLFAMMVVGAPGT